MSDVMPDKRPVPKAVVNDDKDYSEITYIPGPQDLPRVKWHNIEFKAHVPVKVRNTDGYLVPLRQEALTADGDVRAKSPERKVTYVELARGNPSFSVNGEAPFSRTEGKSRTPDSPDAYRGYAINWIARSNDAATMDARWQAEADLRERCGCDDNDLMYLRPFFEAQHDRVSAA